VCANYEMSEQSEKADGEGDMDIEYESGLHFLYEEDSDAAAQQAEQTAAASIDIESNDVRTSSTETGAAGTANTGNLAGSVPATGEDPDTSKVPVPSTLKTDTNKKISHKKTAKKNANKKRSKVKAWLEAF